MGVNDIKEAGRSAADTVRKYIEDVAELRDQLEALAAHRVVSNAPRIVAGASPAARQEAPAHAERVATQRNQLALDLPVGVVGQPLQVGVADRRFDDMDQFASSSPVP